jgi:saccharopine dehydrogenase-like NADP-dependent oxidoreductase
MSKIVQIGSGMIGSTMAYDLSQEHDVVVGDYDDRSLANVKKLNQNITTQKLDVTNQSKLKEFISESDIVLLAVPGHLGYSALRTIVESKKNVVDISFSNENFLDLHNLAKDAGVTAVVDAGLAPGIPNYLLGFHNSQMEIDTFEYYVGGLPKYPKPPFNYKAPFSPIDVIEEYTRPARMMVNGQIVTKPALSGIETMDFENIGTLEAFNTDGLRSILFTMKHIKNMKEKTLRYSGHAALMANYRNAGKFNDDQILKTSKELFEAWNLETNEPEVTVMKIIIKGESKSISYDLFDEYDSSLGFTSMSRTTGFTATATINIVLKNLFNEKGVFPPELLGVHPKCVDYLKEYLKERNILINEKIENY